MSRNRQQPNIRCRVTHSRRSRGQNCIQELCTKTEKYAPLWGVCTSYPACGFTIDSGDQGLEVGSLHVHVAGRVGDVPVVAFEGRQDEVAFDFLGRQLFGRSFAIFKFLAVPGTWVDVPAAAPRISDGSSAGVIVATGSTHRSDASRFRVPAHYRARRTQHALQGVRRNRGNGVSILCRELLQEVGGEHGNIIAAFAQRRQRDWDDTDPIEQLLAERPVGDHGFQVAISGSDQPHVGFMLACVANRCIHAFLQDAEQFGLQRERSVSDLIEKQRAAIGSFEQPLLRGGCAGETPLTWPNSSLSSRLSCRPAVDGHESPTLRGPLK